LTEEKWRRRRQRRLRATMWMTHHHPPLTAVRLRAPVVNGLYREIPEILGSHAMSPHALEMHPATLLATLLATDLLRDPPYLRPDDTRRPPAIVLLPALAIDPLLGRPLAIAYP
jgi:hypothetical protein